MEENISSFYLEKLSDIDKPAELLCEFFIKLFGNVNSYVKLLVTIRKLIKLYGRMNVFLSICDAYEMDNVDTNNIQGLLVYFIKKRITNKIQDINFIDSSRIEKALGKVRKIRIETPFGDD